MAGTGKKVLVTGGAGYGAKSISPYMNIFISLDMSDLTALWNC